jgi:hypothetical protein
VYVAGGTFTLNGGEISGNTAYSGGGVYVADGTFTLNGGDITGNTAFNSSSSGGGGGGGVYVANGTFTMSNGEISGNTSSSNGGGVCVAGGGTFTMSNGEISGNTSSFNGGGVYISIASATVYGTFKKQPATASSTSGTIYGYTGDIKGNKVTNNAGAVQSGRGHAVLMISSPVKKREATAGETQHMDSTVSGSAGGWE